MNKNIKNFLLAILGGALVGLASGWILLPLKLSTGGFSGISTLVYYVFGYPAGVVSLIMNIPLFLISLKVFGVKYSVRIFSSMLSLSLMLEISEIWKPLTNDMVLASVFGGVLIGIGLAIAVRGDSTTGGTDLVAKLIQTKRKYLNMGEILLVIDGIIIAISSFTFENIEIALYSGIAVFVMTKIMDLFLEGGNYAKAMFIISNKSEEISDFILNEIGRGATLLDGKGAYTKEDKNILMCVANKKEIPKLKERINEIDDKCFIIITTVTEAIGQGWKNN